MQGKAKLLGHPVHQMLIVFPLGLLATAVVFDIVRLATGNPYWAEISYWMIASGLIEGQQLTAAQRFSDSSTSARSRNTRVRVASARSTASATWS